MYKYQLLLIAFTYLVAIIASFPLSLYGVLEENCDLYTNYKYHLLYLILIPFVLIVTDVYSMIINKSIKQKAKEINPLLESNE